MSKAYDILFGKPEEIRPLKRDLGVHGRIILKFILHRPCWLGMESNDGLL
jgi:hypothetical protein